MASTYSTRLKLELMEAGANAGVWGNNTNENLQVIDAAVGGYLAKSVAGSANVTLTSSNRDPDVETTNEAANKVIEFTGTLSGNIYVFLPAVEKEYIFHNNTTGSYTLHVAPTGHAANGIAITQGTHTVAYVKDGDDMVDLFADGTKSLGTVNVAVLNATTVTGDGSGLTGIEAFPSSTKMLFQQSAAPTGWTKQTTHNNKALRVVTGSVSSGGSNTFAAAFNTNNAVSGTTGGSAVTISGSTGSHTLTLSEIPSHRHLEGGHVEFGTGDSVSAGTRNTGNSSGAKRFYTDYQGGGGGHTHTAGSLAGDSHTHSFSTNLNLDVQYVDLIIAAKD
jgi:hypothetical protein|tara:strand:+ start:2011 stop:3012 length:1002 start_codon:yes stop_codon:yes gene_type:complete